MSMDRSHHCVHSKCQVLLFLLQYLAYDLPSSIVPDQSEFDILGYLDDDKQRLRPFVKTLYKIANLKCDLYLLEGGHFFSFLSFFS